MYMKHITTRYYGLNGRERGAPAANSSRCIHWASVPSELAKGKQVVVSVRMQRTDTIFMVPIKAQSECTDRIVAIGIMLKPFYPPTGRRIAHSIRPSHQSRCVGVAVPKRKCKHIQTETSLPSHTHTHASLACNGATRLKSTSWLRDTPAVYSRSISKAVALRQGFPAPILLVSFSPNNMFVTRSNVCVALALLALLLGVSASSSFEAHRLIQYDVEGEELGSRRAALSNIAISGLAEPDASLEQDLLRNVAVLIMADATVDRITDLVDKRGAAGLLFILPTEADIAALSDSAVSAWEQVESWLVARKFDIPVYFAESSESLEQVVEGITSASSGSDNFQFTTSVSEASAIPAVTAHNFQGWLHSAELGGESPSIAIAANYDAFAASPTRAFGVGSNGSGAVTLLEVARIFSRLYSEAKSHGKVNLLFILTGGDALNYIGTKALLKSIDSRTYFLLFPFCVSISFLLSLCCVCVVRAFSYLKTEWLVKCGSVARRFTTAVVISAAVGNPA